MNFLSLEKHAEQIESVPIALVVEYLVASIALGIILMIIAVWSGWVISDKAKLKKKDKEKDGAEISLVKARFEDLIMGSANVLFLCFGMTGIMILVANNLARAFAIGAAIAIVRFRIKFDSNGLGSTFLFGILVGMACGVGQILTAVGITFAYGMLQAFLMILISVIHRNNQKSI
jgi:hypothetical protein